MSQTEAPDMSNAHMDGDRPACESPEQELDMVCHVCGKQMEIAEKVSMGPGYSEWEGEMNYLQCPECGAQRELEEVS